MKGSNIFSAPRLIYLHIHTHQQIRTLLIPPPFLYPISLQSVYTWAKSSHHINLVFNLSSFFVIIFSHSLPWPSLTSSHLSPLIIIFCPEGEFLHHRFCHLHHSLLFSLSILPPCLLFTHLQATKSFTGRQHINTQ